MGAFNGILIEQSSGASVYTFPFGFRGIILEYPTGIRFIKVTDYRGTPLQEATVIVHNSGGDYEQVTDELGIAAVEIDVAGTVTIDLKKNLTNKAISYTYSSESLTKNVILQPRLLT